MSRREPPNITSMLRNAANIPQYVRLRDLIRHIRSQKTMADERAVIQKELAVIRTAFKEEDVEYRTRNVAKVLYIHMLGYPTHFAQLECLKLVASPKFGDKRMGYLGAQMLLDEKSDVHLLLTNSLKTDMNSSNQFVVSLALCTLANICSTDMARDLSPEVEKLLKSSNATIRKKAALCACRIVRKVPDLMENYVPLVRQLLNERNHGVLLTGVTLVFDMCHIEAETLDFFKRMVPNLVRMLKTLVMSGHTPDHDVSGITDPFLQVKILQLLAILGKNDAEASDQMNDILAQVATNTESAKNVGNAILYECARTIMHIRAESGLRVLSINILGRFLLNTDKNIRYVALNTLLKCVTGEMQAVQRHRSTIVDCLKDPDVSIRRRALELIFALMNKGNVRALMREILAFLDVADTEFKGYMCSSIATSAARYAPNKRWHMDTLLKMLTSAGNYVTEELVTTVVHMITNTEDLHAYMTQRLYLALQDDISQQPTVQIAAWCIGEYGDDLVAGGSNDDGEEPIDATEEDVIDMLEGILFSGFSTQVTKGFVINSLIKLASRLDRENERIEKIIDYYQTSMDLELQQRSVEYSQLFKSEFISLRGALLEPMPLKEVNDINESMDTSDGEEDRYDRQRRPSDGGRDRSRSRSRSLSPKGRGRGGVSRSPSPPRGGGGGGGGGDIDLLGDLLGGDDLTSSPTPTATQQAPMGGGDLLDLLGGGGGGGGSVPAQQPPPSSGGGGDLLDLLGGGGGAAPAPAPASGGGRFPQLEVYNKNNVRIVFDFEKNPNNPTQIAIKLTATNTGSMPISAFQFQAAVPKTLKLQINAASGQNLPPNGQGAITQIIKIANPSQAALRMRTKLSFSTPQGPINDQGAVDNFPAGL